MCKDSFMTSLGLSRSWKRSKEFMYQNSPGMSWSCACHQPFASPYGGPKGRLLPARLINVFSCSGRFSASFVQLLHQ